MIYRFGDCTFDTVRDEVQRSGEVVHTRPQVLTVLRYLLEHRDRVVSRDELFDQCWPESYVSDSALSSCLKRVRQAIGQTQRGPTMIATRHRRGYQFVAEVTVLAETAPAPPEAPMTPPEVSSPVPPEGGLEAPPAIEPVAQPLASPPARPPEAASGTERRHLTVLSCTLADAERFTQQLDPEDHYDLMQTLRAITLATITPHEGYVAQSIDRGMLVYFGYPQAQEDAAQRAVRSGLALVEALGQVVSTGLAADPSGVAVGVGIDSGIMLVAAGASLEMHQTLAMGNALPGAVELSQWARPGTVVISEATARLVDGYFVYKALDTTALAAQPESQVAYEVLAESAMQTRIEIGLERGLTPLVGREAELAVLRDRWAHAQEGMGQGVMLRGEPGIGKSRLLQALKEQVADEQPQLLECRCSPYHQYSAFYPVIELMYYMLLVRSAASGADTLSSLETLLEPHSIPLHESVPLLAALLSLPLPEVRYAPLTTTPERQRKQTLDLLWALLVSQASEAPLLFIVEDLHWADPSTLEFLALLIEQVPTTSILMLLACRPSVEVPWRESSWLTPITLNRLTRPQNYEMITQVVSGKAFSAAVAEQLAEKTDGVPLFVEELVRTVLETGRFEETDTGYELVGELSELLIPPTLHDSLMARLDHLGAAREIAQWGAALGREFTYEMIEKVTPHHEEVLQAGLDRLVELELVFQRGLARQAQYRFKHALVQDVAYASLRRRMKQDCHQRIAEVLVEDFPEIVALQPELLAHHYTEAGCVELAIPEWQRAGDRATARSANAEAIRHLNQGLELLEALPETSERDRQELTLLNILKVPLAFVKGYASPEVEHLHLRARELCRQEGNQAELFQTLAGLNVMYVSRIQLRKAMETADDMLQIALSLQDVGMIFRAYNSLSLNTFHAGVFKDALTYLNQGLEFCELQEDYDPTFNQRVRCLNYTSWTIWFLGYPDQSLVRLEEARAAARELSHPNSLGSVMHFASTLYKWRREAPRSQEQAEEAMALAREHGLHRWLAGGMIRRGWALAEQGSPEAGLAELHEGLAMWREVGGGEMGWLNHLTMRVEAHRRNGHLDEGLHLLDEALAAIPEDAERFYEAEAYRLRGELIREIARERAAEEAEMNFRQAIEIAREQSAKSLELRALMSLCRLYGDQGRKQEGYPILVEVYDWFTEGFDTPDLQDAKMLLEAFSRGESGSEL